MNYRHGYHAGNFADVLKHAALCELLRLLTSKDKKLFVLDTHAGAGGYDLSTGPARRTGEGEGGVGRPLRGVRAASGGGAGAEARIRRRPGRRGPPGRRLSHVEGGAAAAGAAGA